MELPHVNLRPEEESSWDRVRRSYIISKTSLPAQPHQDRMTLPILLIVMATATHIAQTTQTTGDAQAVRKVVLISGSTDGLGREVARRLAASGAHVIVHGRNRERGAALV